MRAEAPDQSGQHGPRWGVLHRLAVGWVEAVTGAGHPDGVMADTAVGEGQRQASPGTGPPTLPGPAIAGASLAESAAYQ